jgi:hypothetical protein
MSLLTLNQVVRLAEVPFHVHAGGFALEAGHPVTKHPLVGVLHTRSDEGAGELSVRHENRVADVHLAKRDVDAAAFARLTGWERYGFVDGEHGAFPLGWVSKQIVKGELRGMHTAKTRYHLPTSLLPLAGAGGSGYSPELARVSSIATTSTTYYFKRMGYEGSDPLGTRKKGWAWGARPIRCEKIGRGGSEGRPIPLRPSAGAGSSHYHLGGRESTRSRHIPTPNAHEMRTRTETQIGSNAQDLRITAKKAEVRR